MPAQSSDPVATRHYRLMSLLAEGPCTIEEMIAGVTPRASRRTILGDLAWVRKRFPHQVTRAVAAGQHGTGRIVYGWNGPLPHLLTEPLSFLAEDELVALVAARGLLRDVHPLDQGDDQDDAGDDHLASAVSRMLARAGLRQQAKVLARHTVTINRFGTEPLQPGVLESCLTATSLGEALHLTYSGLYRPPKPVHIVPKRMHLIKGEWYCLAWCNGRLCTYRLSRMTGVTRTRDLPKECPSFIPSEELDAVFSGAFFATSGQGRESVSLLVGEAAWPHVRARRWGINTKFDADMRRVPKGWHRVTFTTTGIWDCAHWVLGLGSDVRVEGPLELRRWIKKEASLIAGTAGRS